MVNMARRYKAITEHLSCDLNGEAVILNIKNGKYYGVNAVGASIWAAMQNPVSFDDIRFSLLEEYAIDEATCQKDISVFLERMTEENLVEIFDDKIL